MSTKIEAVKQLILANYDVFEGTGGIPLPILYKWMRAEKLYKPGKKGATYERNAIKCLCKQGFIKENRGYIIIK